MLRHSIILLLAFSLFCSSIYAQKKDSVKTHHHSPNAAMIMSMCVPGLGQAYNKKFWKIPIIYAGLGTTIYFFNFNNKYYRKYKQGYINKTDSLTTTTDLYPEYTNTQLKELQDYHRKYRDLNVILTALVYTLNVVDAYVDGHLMNFDVSDNLSMHVAPSLQLQAYSGTLKPAPGLSLSFHF